MNILSPTPFPDVNEILHVLLTNVQRILANNFVGMYLFGSLANGDFDQYSDIDVLIVTNDEIRGNAFDALTEMHMQIQQIASPWAVQLEVSYIPRQALRRYDPANNEHPHLDRDAGERLHVRRHETDWIVQRHVLRERGV
ncbi:MAG TPA: nucleotidyltransferase domain-containing protein, partial [Anaerolineales bacterium]|nr:nucleotidyltransferase domain-containing protein [Anaerolineales bacterium]